MEKVIEDSEEFGELIAWEKLTESEQELVSAACAATKFSYAPQSKFAVGSAIMATNDEGHTKLFRGCNVENELISVGVCAERNAGSTAIGEGYRKFKKIAVVAFDSNPGGNFSGASPCGLCRQFIAQWSTEADILIVVDADNNVRRAAVRDLLPVATGGHLPVDSLSTDEKAVVSELLSHKFAAYVPYSGNTCKVVLLANNGEAKQTFAGVETELVTYSGSITAVGAACSAAVTAGF